MPLVDHCAAFTPTDTQRPRAGAQSTPVHSAAEEAVPRLQLIPSVLDITFPPELSETALPAEEPQRTVRQASAFTPAAVLEVQVMPSGEVITFAAAETESAFTAMNNPSSGDQSMSRQSPLEAAVSAIQSETDLFATVVKK